MTRTALSSEEMQVYRATARQRAARRRTELDARYARAWQAARRAAHLLQKEFGADCVLLFGSLLKRRRFHAHSDIDLAAWGIEERAYLSAISALLDLDPEFSFDLVRMEEAREVKEHESLFATITREGQEL